MRPIDAPSRLRALARHAAREDHAWAIVCGPRGAHTDRPVDEADPDLGFARCPHPDCALVRTALDTVPPTAVTHALARLVQAATVLVCHPPGRYGGSIAADIRVIAEALEPHMTPYPGIDALSGDEARP